MIAAAQTSAFLSLLFLVVYGGANWVTAHRSDVGTWYFAWERLIPFVPLMLVPSMSLDLPFVAAPVVCRDRPERQTLARRISLTIVAVGAGLPAPARVRSAHGEWAARRPVRGAARADRPGQPPAVAPHHVADDPRRYLRTTHAGAHAGGGPRVVDVAGGFILATIGFYLVRDAVPRLPVVRSPRIGAYYAVGGAALALATWPWGGLLLLGPAVALGTERLLRSRPRRHAPPGQRPRADCGGGPGDSAVCTSRARGPARGVWRTARVRDGGGGLTWRAGRPGGVRQCPP